MNTVGRLAVLDLRTIAPYRGQAFVIAVVVMAMLADRPVVVVPALILLAASVTASYPFQISDKADLDTLYAVLPLTRRSRLLGHYTFALATFAVYAAAGTAEAVVSAHVRHVAFGASRLAMVLAVSWSLFALNIAVKFPLFVRFGYTQTGMLGTTLPIAVIAVLAARTHVTPPSGAWLGLAAAAGTAVLAISAVTASAVDPRRVRPPAGAAPVRR